MFRASVGEESWRTVRHQRAAYNQVFPDSFFGKQGLTVPEVSGVFGGFL